MWVCVCVKERDREGEGFRDKWRQGGFKIRKAPGVFPDKWVEEQEGRVRGRGLPHSGRVPISSSNLSLPKNKIGLFRTNKSVVSYQINLSFPNKPIGCFLTNGSKSRRAGSAGGDSPSVGESPFPPRKSGECVG